MCFLPAHTHARAHTRPQTKENLLAGPADGLYIFWSSTQQPGSIVLVHRTTEGGLTELHRWRTETTNTSSYSAYVCLNTQLLLKLRVRNKEFFDLISTAYNYLLWLPIFRRLPSCSPPTLLVGIKVTSSSDLRRGLRWRIELLTNI